MALEHQRFVVTGIDCEGCEQRIQTGLRRLPGVRVARASHTTQQVDVSVETTLTIPAEIATRLGELGYPVTDKPNRNDNNDHDEYI